MKNRFFTFRKDMTSGFTLLEVIVAMSIFSFIAVGTSGAVSRGLQVKKKVEKEWDETHSLRTTLHRIEQDITAAFHVKKSHGEGSESKWFKTFFIGKEDLLNFTSLAHRKFYEGTHESELCEIGYRLIPQEEDSSKYTLVRREDPIIDEDWEKGGEEYPLIENIKELEFHFYSKSKARWFEEWDTTRRDYEDQFPQAVEVKLTLIRGEKEEVHSTKILIANPANDVPSSQSQGQSGDSS